jgi:cell division control protein 24
MYATFITNEKGATEYIRNVLADPRRASSLLRDPNGKGATEYLADPRRACSVLRESIRLLYLPSQRLPKYYGFLQVCPLLIIPSNA